MPAISPFPCVRFFKRVRMFVYGWQKYSRSWLMTIVIVGAGPTGVELSGAIADMKRFVLPKDYPELDFSTMKIYLLEGTGKTLASMSEESSRQSKQYLEKLGVTVLTNTLLKDY